MPEWDGSQPADLHLQKITNKNKQKTNKQKEK